MAVTPLTLAATVWTHLLVYSVEYNAALTGLYLFVLFYRYHNIVLTGLNTSSGMFHPDFLIGRSEIMVEKGRVSKQAL